MSLNGYIFSKEMAYQWDIQIKAATTGQDRAEKAGGYQQEEEEGGEEAEEAEEAVHHMEEEC